MSRADSRAWVGVILAGAVLTYVGCSSSKSTATGTGASPAQTPPPAGAAAAKSEEGDGSKSSKLLANWPTPRAVLVVTGQMDGYLEPCGCTQGQQGGLIRRLDFLDRLRAQNWPMALIDLGGLVKDPTAARGGFDQAKIKFGIALKAYQTLGYQAIALSPEDLKVGIGEAFGQFLSYLGEPAKIVVANVQPAAGYESHIQPSRVITAGSLKLGVTAVVAPEALAKLADPDKGELLPVVKRPDEVLSSILADLETKSDYQVLMVQASPEEAKRLALAYPGFDVVVATTPSADPLEGEQRLNDGKTLMVQVGRRGKSIGAIGFYPDESQTMRFYLVTLGSRYDGPGTAVKKVIEDEYRSVLLKGAGVVEGFPRHDFVNATAGSTYVGAETCKNCHPNTYLKWSTTKHAQAFTALLNDPKPNTIYDAECVTCHTTGFEYTSGYRSPTATPHLKGNQCENCHGPASKHVSDPDNAEYRKPLKLTAERADKNQLCIHCHDEDNSPKFVFATHWGQIAHKGLDDYKDPRVRRGITPTVARSPADAAGK